jgi:hypothetical protein
MHEKEVPYRDVCDLVFKKDLLPAVYRWVSSLSPENLVRFSRVFPRIAQSILDPSEDDQNSDSCNESYAPSSTMPEWTLFQTIDQPRQTPLSPEFLLSRPTSSHLTYGAFDADQMRACRGVPTRTREHERSHIHTAERCGANMDRWKERAMTTTYRRDLCGAADRPAGDPTADQIVIVYSKGTLNAEAASAAAGHIARDPAWTREFREMCRGLAEAINATAYRAGFSGVKAAPVAQHTRPKWSDPTPVSHGLARPAETFWQTSHQAAFVPAPVPAPARRAADRGKAEHVLPFDLHPGAEKMTTATREAFRDHAAEREERSEYYADAWVRTGPASAVAGRIVGRRM